MSAGPRLTAGFWVAAHLRLCASQGAQAVLVRRGDETAGTVLLKLNTLDGRAVVLAPTVAQSGARAWMRVTGTDPVPEPEADAALARAVSRDPDAWIVEIEDRAGRHFLSEPIL